MSWLIVDDNPAATRDNVRSTLSFMASTFMMCARSDDEFSSSYWEGAAMIVNLCCEALSEPEGTEGKRNE